MRYIQLKPHFFFFFFDITATTKFFGFVRVLVFSRPREAFPSPARLAKCGRSEQIALNVCGPSICAG